jgi:1-acyl-sn-glycerol-3-phosphate acyltransferase
MKLISRFIFWIAGWKIEGRVPAIKKFVVIGAPHTSAWDAVYGLCAAFLLDLHFSFFGKKEAFYFPLGILLRALGGIPVDRFSSNNVVDEAVKEFNSREEFILALAPEGTRAYAPEWRTGFYYIAMEARVPIVLGYLDFKRKVVGIGPTFYPTGDINKDIEEIKAFYRPIQGKHPEKGVR